MAPFSKRLTTTFRRPPRDADQVDLELQAPQSRSEVFELKSPRVQPHSRRPPRKPEARSLLSLPPEIQLLVFRFLDFGEIEALRRTCHHFRSLLEHDAVIDLFGSVPRLHDAQLATCCVCLQRTEPAKRIWVDPASDRNWPLAGKCTSCAYAEGDLQIDKMVTLGDWSNCYVCRWCGQPAIQPEGSYLLKTHEFHHKCWLRYKVAILFRRAMGAVSFLLTLIPAVLALVLLNQEWQLVVASVLCLVLSISVAAMQIFKPNAYVGMHHYVALANFTALVLWILVLAYLLTHHYETAESDSGYAVFLAATYFNVPFRFLDTMGNVLLMTDYKPWMHNQPRRSIAGRIWSHAMHYLMIWTWPRCVEYSWPPEPHWFPDNAYGRCLYRLRRHGTLRRVPL